MLFDRICLNNGIRHLLTAPYSPTTTGKIERLHKTIRKELLAGRTFTSIEQAQAELDRWVTHYNLSREHAVSVTTKGFNIHTVGVILLAVGIAAFIIGLLFVVAGGTRRATMREDIRNTPSGHERVVEERDNLAP